MRVGSLGLSQFIYSLLTQTMDQKSYQEIYQRIIDIKAKQNQQAQPTTYNHPPERSSLPYQYPGQDHHKDFKKQQNFPQIQRQTHPYSTSHQPYPHNYASQLSQSQHQPIHYPITRERPESIPLNAHNNMYPLGMQHSGYPFNYPYYSYPGFSYPYGSMYPPPPYYNRPPNELYHPSDRLPQGYSPYFPPQNNFSSSRPYPSQSPAFPTHQAKQSIVKQEIVISSDEQKILNEPINPLLVSDKPWGVSKSEVNCEAMKKQQKRGELAAPQVLNRQQDDNPFYIKHKRIRKEEKTKTSKNELKKHQLDPKSEDKESKNFNKLKQKDSKQKNNEQMLKNTPEGPSILISQENKNVAQVSQALQKQAGKRERVRDDHPLRQLRYSESHGRIRIGNYYQSTIPDLLDSTSIAVLRKKMQLRLQQRQVSALTF